MSEQKVETITVEVPERISGWYEMDLSGLSQNTRCIAAMLDAGAWLGLVPVGWIVWDVNDASVQGVYVNEEYRRSGIANYLLGLAGEAHGSPLTDSGEYTPEGFKWAKAAGLNPKMRKRVKKADIARYTSTLTMNMMGGGRCERLIKTIEQSNDEE